MMAIDYKANTQAALSASDRNHFATISEIFGKLAAERGNRVSTACEREALSAFLYHHLHEPCKILAIPLDSAMIYIEWFFTFTDSLGRYKGCVHRSNDKFGNGIVRVFGLDDLAMRFHMDETVLIPRLIPDPELRNVMLQKLRTVSKMYFSSIEGIDGSTRASDGPSGWEELQTVSYTLTEQAKRFQALHMRITTTCNRLMRLSPAHWLGQVTRCIQSFVERNPQNQSSQGKGKNVQPSARKA